MTERITRVWVARQLSGSGATTAEISQWARDYDPRNPDAVNRVATHLVWLESTGRAAFYRGRWTLTPAGREFASGSPQPDGANP